MSDGSNNIQAPKWLLYDIEVLNRHYEMADKIQSRIETYLERIDYETDPGWDGRHHIKIVTGEVMDQDGKQYLKVEGYTRAKANGDGVFVHQVAGICGDDFSGEFYIPCGDGRYVQVHFWC